MRYLILIVFYVLIQNVNAQTIDLKESMERMSKNSPLIEEISIIRLEKYSSEMEKTKLENFEIEYGHNLEGRDGEFSISQPFRISDLSFFRQKYKSNLNKINDLEKEIDELKLHHEFLILYYDLYILQEDIETQFLNFKFLEQAKSTISKSINRNGMTSSQILAFDADILNVRTNLIEKKNNFRKMKIKFLQNINMRFSNITLDRPDLIEVHISLEDLLRKLKNYPSSYKLLLLKYNQAKYERQILQQDRFISSIEPKVGYGYDNYEKTDDFSLGLTLSIPLWNRQTGKYSELKTNERYMEKQLKAFENISFEEIVKNIYNQLLNQIEIVKEYENNIIPLYKKSAEKVEDNFLNGQVPILNVWEIRDKYAQAKMQMLNAMKSALEIKNEFELLIGNKMENLK